MEDSSVEARRERVLRKVVDREFSGVRFAPAEAIVAFIPEPGGPAPAVRDKLAVPFVHRVYPVEGGYLVKWPYQGEAFDPGHFRLEPGGWDHEHCSACEASIGAGAECWFTADGADFLLCGACYDRLLERRPEPGP